jgi:hypothetical protein
MNRSAHRVALAVLVAGLLAGCGDDGGTATTSSTSTSTPDGGSAPVMDPGDGGDYQPQLDTLAIADAIDNPYMPLAVGSRWRYEGESDGVQEVIDIVVTPDRKLVMGISAFVVRDTVTADGELVEDTYDWYAQDSAGNVWYLGEDAKEYENGVVVSIAGSWEAGVDGALPGIVMPAAPHVGDVLRQEYLPGEAEDMMKIIATGGTATVPAGIFTAVLTTQDWTPLDPDVVEEKAYAPGVGKLRETKVAGASGYAELVEYTVGV